MAKVGIEEILYRIGNRLQLIEAAVVDNRKLMTRVMEQSNELLMGFKHINNLVDFIVPDEELEKELKKIPSPLYIDNYMDMAKSIYDRMNELRKLEEELEKYKDEITPGTMGES
jgi:hypothetical protein|tara:strand:+ start:473 stop:814 length:342 start_codon:yes stop_codon:yes gene_type:complete